MLLRLLHIELKKKERMSWVVCTRLISLRSPIFINAGKKLSCSLKASLYCIPQKHNVAQNSSSASLSVPEMFRRDQIVPDIIATPPPVLAKVCQWVSKIYVSEWVVAGLN